MPLTEKGKRTVFLVPTVVLGERKKELTNKMKVQFKTFFFCLLAIQQANYLRRHTHLNVKEYYGSMGVDLWSENQYVTYSKL